MKSFPFRSVKVIEESTGNIRYDRGIDANDYREMFNGLVSNGVLMNPSTNLQVSTIGNDMSVLVAAGKGYVKGNVYWEDMQRKLILEAANNQDRIDRVVVRFNDDVDERRTDLFIVKGTPSSVPQPPALTRNETVYELCLAEIYIQANSTTISASRITDKRLDKELCGIVHGLIEQLDTSTLNQQYEEWLKEVKAKGEQDINDTKQHFDNFVSNRETQIQEVLDTRKFSTTYAIEVNKSGWNNFVDHYEIIVPVEKVTPSSVLVVGISETVPQEVFENVTSLQVRPIKQDTGNITLRALEPPTTFILNVAIIY